MPYHQPYLGMTTKTSPSKERNWRAWIEWFRGLDCANSVFKRWRIFSSSDGVAPEISLKMTDKCIQLNFTEKITWSQHPFQQRLLLAIHAVTGSRMRVCMNQLVQNKIYHEAKLRFSVILEEATCKRVRRFSNSLTTRRNWCRQKSEYGWRLGVI